ncbi:MAG: transketolase family protein, partial [Planctomycetota bacterium]
MSERSAPRDVLGQTLTDLGATNPNVIVLDADFWPASKVAAFKDRFPKRFIQVGIAEQNMIGIAAGLSTLG